jgi:DNA-binding CsgD family transcriptional regulator/tetratricopeptide (TPR) repeat protein
MELRHPRYAASAATGVHQLDTRWPRPMDHVRAAVAHPQRSRDHVHDLVTGRRELSLRGRSHECGLLDRLVQDVSSGRSGAVVLRGEPGVGKTALLDYAVESASGLTVVRSVGVESEMELPFAALHQLCAPMLDRLDRLPGPQREALGTVFGLSAGPAPDRFLVGLAVLSLLSEAAEERPLLCVVDDAQWLDRESAQGLAFVARRLVAESVAMIFATRETSGELRCLPELTVPGLADADARQVLDSAVRGPLDEDVRERIIAETRGNPLALLELPRGLTSAELAGGFALQDAPALSGRIEESFQRRLETMPPDTRLLLLAAAAEPLGDVALLWRAAERLGITPQAVQPAKAADLLELGAHVRFRHPLVRSAVYSAASLADRQRVHRALAEATDADADPDRRAWHRAQGTPGVDDEVAEQLERSAGRARRRGGLAAAAAFLERAAGLSSDPARRAQRSLAAAQVKHLAGASQEALGLLVSAEAGPLDDLGRVRVNLLRAQIDYSLNSDSGALQQLLEVGKRLEPLDAGLARETYLDGLSAATYIGCRAQAAGVLELAQAALAAPPPSETPRPHDLLLEGLAKRFTEGYAAGVPPLKRALSAFPDDEAPSEKALPSMWLACRTAADLWDDGAWEALAACHVERARAAGALTLLPLALDQRIAAHTFAGEMTAAASLIEELHSVTEATGSEVRTYGRLLVAVWGRETDAHELIEATKDEALDRGEGAGLTIAYWAAAVLYNGLGRYAEALEAAQHATEHPEDLGFANWALAELVLAAARSGDSERAAEAVERLSALTRASGTDWALGLEARCRALVSEGDVADALYREAIERLGRTRIRVELARAHLQYGEWLRRERRRLEARNHLRIAQDMLCAMDVETFTERVSRELLATGARARKRTPETREDLTAQELQVARLGREGLSNPEIGARLFISPRTVEYHLSKVFTKLGISSRNQLDRVIAGEPISPTAA